MKITLLASNGGRVDWVAPGKPILFDRRSASGYCDVWTVEADGSQPLCLTRGKPELPKKHKGNPAWHPSGEWNEHGQLSPDGKFVVWVSNRQAKWDCLNLWILPTNAPAQAAKLAERAPKHVAGKEIA